jgi:hypothetical protein
MATRARCKTTGKVRLADPGEAKEAIVTIKSTGRFYDHIQRKRINRRAGKPGQCRAYYCEHCHGWHLTSNEKTKSLKKTKKDRKTELKNFLLNKEEIAEWKKDSLPFPEQKIKL